MNEAIFSMKNVFKYVSVVVYEGSRNRFKMEPRTFAMSIRG